MIKEILKHVIVLGVPFAIFLGIPIYFGTGFIAVSWIPAFFVFAYLDDELKK